MPIVLKPAETFRGDFSFSNSRAAIERFPFPFNHDEYMYAVNIEPHSAGTPGSVYEHPLDVDEHYLSEVAERRLVLAEDPNRSLSLPHMALAEWDALELILECFAASYPEHFQLHTKGSNWIWENRPMALRQQFVFGDAATLPCSPLEYATRQAQGDFVLLDQRDGNLYADAGMVTGPADWSLEFDLGMTFQEWHGPVPLAHELGVFDRALKFLLNLQIGRPVRRLNWTMTIHPRLDTSPETYDRWGPDRMTVTHDNAGRFAHLRTELQSLYRLPRSNGILFSIRTYLINLEELATVPSWVARLYKVLQTLPAEVVEYKGLRHYRDTVLGWLSRKLAEEKL